MTGKDVLKFELRDTPAGPSASSTETPCARCIYSVESLRVYIWEEARVAPVHQRLMLGTIVIRGDSLRAAGVVDDSVITLVVGNHVQVVGGGHSFAALLWNESVVTWGLNSHGGDSSTVKGQLTDVKEIITNERAMAALKYDGTVVTWGVCISGGDNASVRNELHDVRTVEAMNNAMFAIKNDGTVVSCGQVGKVPDLDGCEGFAGTIWNFAAINREGGVVTWGDNERHCAPREPLSLQLQGDVKAVTSTLWAFAARKADGSVVVWGKPDAGGDIRSVQHQLQNVQSITASTHAFAAILQDRSVVTWGESLKGGDSSTVHRQLHDVQSISHAEEAFAALRRDGSVVAWGGAWRGGRVGRVEDQLQGEVTEILGNRIGFAALKTDGRAVTWGDHVHNYYPPADQLQEVQAIAGSRQALAAVQRDGRVVTWGDPRGDPRCGGDSSHVQDQLQGHFNRYQE